MFFNVGLKIEVVWTLHIYIHSIISRDAMFDRLTMKQSESDDQVMFIRKSNQKRTETEAQIRKIEKGYSTHSLGDAIL